jgi:hypothetical protein
MYTKLIEMTDGYFLMIGWIVKDQESIVDD